MLIWGGEIIKYIALYWFSIHMIYVKAQKTNYEDAQETHDSVTYEEVERNGKTMMITRKLSFIYHVLLLEMKTENKYDKILTIINFEW